MKNIARLLLSLLATSALVCAATIAQPSGLIILKGQTKEYVNEIIQTPFVTVEAGGTLILRGTTLLVDGASEGAGNVHVKPGGTMLILNGSNVTSANSYSYTFWVNETANFEMRDSGMSKCGRVGGPTDYHIRGMLIKADSAIIENTVFGDNHFCIIVSGAKNAGITKNTFNGCYRAITLNGTSSARIENNDFKTGEVGQYSLYLASSVDALVSDNTFENPAGIGLLKTNSSIIRNNEFGDSTGPSITLSTENHDSKENVLENNTIAGRLKVQGVSNTINGGSVGTELFIGT